MSLPEIYDRLVTPYPSTKDRSFYELYEEYFAPLEHQPITMLELGVYRGDSTKVFATYFRNGKIVAVDNEDHGVDFAGFTNIEYVLGDQRKEPELRRICETHAPGGIDIVIDDASHFGAWSLLSYEALLPHVKPGGLYVVEDWATGYWDDWADGNRFQQYPPDFTDTEIPRRLPSHDFGMVGFVKRFVDEVAWQGIRPSMTAPVTRARKLEFMHLHPAFAVLKKAQG